MRRLLITRIILLPVTSRQQGDLVRMTDLSKRKSVALNHLIFTLEKVLLAPFLLLHIVEKNLKRWRFPRFLYAHYGAFR